MAHYDSILGCLSRQIAPKYEVSSWLLNLNKIMVPQFFPPAPMVSYTESPKVLSSSDLDQLTSIWHKFWHSIWYSIYLDIYSDILFDIQSIWTYILTRIQTFWKFYCIWHFLWHSIWHQTFYLTYIYIHIHSDIPSDQCYAQTPWVLGFRVRRLGNTKTLACAGFWACRRIIFEQHSNLAGKP